MKYLYLLVFQLCLFGPGLANTQDSLLVIPRAQALSFGQKLQSFTTVYFTRQQKIANSNDLVIGMNDPDEIVTITGFYRLEGNLTIVNNGKLVLESADFYINGDILIMGNGTLDIRGGKFTIIQEYIYEHRSTVIENGGFLMNNATFSSSNQSWDIGMTNDACLQIHDSHITKGFITTGMMENSSADIARTTLPGEFLCFNNNTIHFSKCDSMLFWLVLPESSKVDLTLPTDSLVAEFEFSGDTPGVQGIDYSVTIDSCTNVWWGTIAISGCNAVFRDSELRAVGLYVNIPDSVTISNLTNGYQYSDKVLDMPDRYMRMVNTKVQTWNFYGAMDANFTIQNCVFGEVLAMDSSYIIVDNSVCDGSGGYIGAFGKSVLILFRTLNMSQTIARENGILVAAMSSLLGTEIDTDESAAMGLLNTGYLAVPQAHGSSIIFEEKIGWIDGKVDEQVPVTGTARLLSGPENPMYFKQYGIEFTPGLRNSEAVWQETDGFHKQPVENGLLALWNTDNLSPGAYGLRLTLYPSIGDSLTLETDAMLMENTSTHTDVSNKNNVPNEYRLYQNYPNPFNPVTRISYELNENGPVELFVYNIRGEKLATLVNSQQSAGHYEILWNGMDEAGHSAASGVYYYTIRTKGFESTRKMVLIR